MATGVQVKNGKIYLRATVDGREIIRRSSKTSIREAATERAAWIAFLEEQKWRRNLGLPVNSDKMTVGQAWEEYAKTAREKAGWPQAESRMRIHVLPELGHKRLRAVVPDDVERLLAKKAKEGRSPWTLRHIRMRLVVLFNWAKKNGLYTSENPAQLAAQPEIQQKLPNPVPSQHIHAIIEAVPDEWRTFFAFAVYTGLRCGELRAIRPGDFDPDHRFLKVQRSGARSRTKTAKPRLVPLPAALLPHLHHQLALVEKHGWEWLFADGAGRQISKHVRFAVILRGALDTLGMVTEWRGTCWYGCRGGPHVLKERSAWRCPKCGKTGRVEPWASYRFHDLRKTWETELYGLSNDSLGVARIAGHGHGVAAEIYIGRDAKRLAAIANTLDYKNLSQVNPVDVVDAPPKRSMSDTHGIDTVDES